jgi:hypothetical protein
MGFGGCSTSLTVSPRRDRRDFGIRLSGEFGLVEQYGDVDTAAVGMDWAQGGKLRVVLFKHSAVNGKAIIAGTEVE